MLIRPFLGVPKARLIATLRAAGICFVDDPTNHDPRFARPRLRRSMAALATEGLDAKRLAVLAARARRADQALEWAVDEVARHASPVLHEARGLVAALEDFRRWPEEIALRVLGRAIAVAGSEGPIELRKLETLVEALRSRPAAGQRRWRRTLAGAMVTVSDGRITIEPAPRRRFGGDSAPSRGGPALREGRPSPERFTRNEQ